jgi:hypothetical protein
MRQQEVLKSLTRIAGIIFGGTSRRNDKEE